MASPIETISGFFGKLRESWSTWSMQQKLVFGVVVIAVLGSVFAFTSFNTASVLTPIFGAPIKDEALLSRITTRLDEEGINYVLSGENTIISVADSKEARKARAVLVREGLTPNDINPWELFDVDRWTTSDFLNNVNLQRSISSQLKLHIESLDDVDKAQVTIAVPKDELFTDDKNPTTVSVIVSLAPGSDLADNKKKVKGLVNLIKHAVPDLDESNITLSDNFGNQLNDADSMNGSDRIAQLEKLERIKKDQQKYYLDVFRNNLAGIVTPDRVRVVNVEISNNADYYKATGKKITPVQIKGQDPTKPYDTSEVVPSVIVEEQKGSVTFQGTGFNPQGPAGQEGQTPPAYADLQNTTGNYNQETKTNVYVTNEENYEKESAPIRRENIAVSVAIDGTWEYEHDDKGDFVYEADGVSRKRVYKEISADELKKYVSLVQTAIGYNMIRGDQVTVQNISFDRRASFREQDEEYAKSQSLKNLSKYSGLILLGLIGLIVVIRLVQKELDRRKRLKEEEIALQHQAMREAALRSLEAESAAPDLSTMDRERLELQETAVNLARQHPEDVAQLIRTWLSEEQ